MSGFKIENISELEYSNCISKTLKITRQDKNGKNENMDMKDLKEINDIMEEKLGHDRFMIRVFGIGTAVFCPKDYEKELNVHDIESYSKGRVADNHKFEDEFFQFQISFSQPKPVQNKKKK